MGGREYSALRSPRGATSIGRTLAVPAALVAALASGCDSDAPQTTDARSGGGELGVPPFIASSRAIDTDLLLPVMRVGDTNVEVSRSGNAFTATFTLPDDNTYPLEVIWTYAAVGRAQPIPIARATSQITRTNPERTINVTSYATDFPDVDVDGDGNANDGDSDFDEDGVSNFDEIDQGRDPLTVDGPISPREDQGDCRTTELPDELNEEASFDREVFRFGTSPISRTRAVEFETAGRRLYYATFFLETGGTLVVEHVQGLPADTDALLYDRILGAVGFEGSAEVIVLANQNADGTPDGLRARVAARLRSGLYCYVLGADVSDFADAAPLSDLVLRLDFTPDP